MSLLNPANILNFERQNQTNDGCVTREGSFFTFKNPETKKHEATVRILEFDIKKWVRERLKKTSNMIVAPSGGGKTIFTTFMLANFLRYMPEEKIGIILCSQTPSAYIRLKAANNIAQTPFLDENQVYYSSNIESVISIYWKLQEAYNEQIIRPDLAEDLLADADQERSNFKKKQKERINKLIKNWTHFVFYFDDCSSWYKSKLKTIRTFWESLPTQHRHANITLIYNIQDIGDIPSEMRTNISSLYVVGVIRQLNLFQKNLGYFFPSPYNASPKKFVQFQGQLKSLILPEHLSKSIIIYPAQDPLSQDGASILYVFKVPQIFVDKILDAEKKVQQELTQKALNKRRKIDEDAAVKKRKTTDSNASKQETKQETQE